MDRLHVRLVTAASAMGALVASTLALALGGTLFLEIEPNDDKQQANHVPLLGGAGFTAIQGTGNLAGPDRDYYRLQPELESVVRPYRYRAYANWISTTHTAFLKGLEQSLGEVDADSDVAVQHTVHRHDGELHWYGFGKGEELFLDAGFLDFFRFDYLIDFQRSQTFLEPIAAVFEPGEITITTVGQGHATDTDLWVYNARFDALPGYGNDDDPTLATTRSTLTRTYAPGRYYLAVSDGNLANDEASPPDDLVRSEPVMDFPDVLVDSSMSTNVDLSFAIGDGTTTVNVPAVKYVPHEVLWYSFDVGDFEALVPFCRGSSPAACPCGNDSVPQRGDGCASSSGRGALLYATGSTSVAAGDLACHAHSLPATTPALLFTGGAVQTPAFFGDGLLCIAGPKVRIATVIADERGKATWSNVVGPAGWTAGSTGYAQVWYRDASGPCGSGFNTTNGVEVRLLP